MNAMLAEFNTVAVAAAGSVDKVAKGWGNSGMAMMNLGRIVQDFQGGGLLGITNNMEGMAMALGLGGGIAGAATLAAVALGCDDAPMPQIKALAASLGGSRTKTEAEAMKELADQTDRTAAETDKLNKYKEREAELAKMRAMKPEAEKETQGLVSEFLGTQPGGVDKLTGQLAQALRAAGRGTKFTPDEEAEAAGYRRVIEGAARVGAPRNLEVEARLERLTRRLDEADFGKAGKIITGAPTDKGARDTIRAMAQQFPGAFPKGFAGSTRRARAGGAAGAGCGG